jgi:hypothetical protein
VAQPSKESHVVLLVLFADLLAHGIPRMEVAYQSRYWSMAEPAWRECELRSGSGTTLVYGESGELAYVVNFPGGIITEPGLDRDHSGAARPQSGSQSESSIARSSRIRGLRRRLVA